MCTATTDILKTLDEERCKTCITFSKMVAFSVHIFKPIMKQYISLSVSLHFDKTVNMNGISKGYNFRAQLLKLNYVKCHTGQCNLW